MVWTQEMRRLNESGEKNRKCRKDERSKRKAKQDVGNKRRRHSRNREGNIKRVR